MGMKIMSEGMQRAAGDSSAENPESTHNKTVLSVFVGFIITCDHSVKLGNFVMARALWNASLMTVQQAIGVELAPQ